MKKQLKTKAINLRKKGFSYTEIRNKVPVSKSTLSLWLRNIELNSDQEARLRERMSQAHVFGARAQKKKRIKRTKLIVEKARGEIEAISKKELWLMGIMLYWAEGSKQKKHNPSQRVVFSNSDPLMIKIYLAWLRNCVGIKNNNIVFEIYSHQNHRKSERKMIDYWANITGYPAIFFDKIYYKEDKNNPFRKNRKKNYKGLLRIKVRKSTDLNRRITGWIEGVCVQCGMV